VVDAVISVAFSDKTIGKVINIGNNFEISMNDLAKKIIKETSTLKSTKKIILHIPRLEIQNYSRYLEISHLEQI
jgi:nucleoside-diphosphate-sugar epimerase